MAVTQPLGSPTVQTVMSPVIPPPTSTTTVPCMSKVASPQAGPSNPDPVTTQQLQQMPLGVSHISHGQQMAPAQQVGTHLSQHQGMPQGMPAMMGNFVPASVPPQQMPLNITMMPPPGIPAPTCQVAIQSQMMPVSSMANHQHPIVPGIGQMPVIVSVQPGMDGLPHGMPHLPENVTQMPGAPQLVQMHPVPMTTLPMVPSLPQITCSEMPLPPSLQPISVMSPMVQMPPAQTSVPVSIPSNGGNMSGNMNQPESPIYEVKLDASVKDVVIEKAESVACSTSSVAKTKEETKPDGLKVENGDDVTIIAENVTVTTESEEQSSEASKLSDDGQKDSKCSKNTQVQSVEGTSHHHGVSQHNGER